MKNRKRRFIGIFMGFLMFCSIPGNFSAISQLPVMAREVRYSNFNMNFSLTGDGATDMVTIAEAQTERVASQFGYTEAWCADFVRNCAKINQSYKGEMV